MIIKEQALSRDGYIINQDYTNNIPYGNNTSDYNGCGWISCYNLCHYLKKQIEAKYIINFLEDYLWFNGSWGTSLTGVYKFMKSLGLPVKKLVGKKAIAKSTPKYGILFYFHGKGCHYTFFYKYNNTSHRFLNDSHKELDIKDLAQMLDKEVKCNICTAFIVQ